MGRTGRGLPSGMALRNPGSVRRADLDLQGPRCSDPVRERRALGRLPHRNAGSRVRRYSHRDGDLPVIQQGVCTAQFALAAP